MEAPKLLLAKTWDGEEDLTGWWISEKLDGVRALWDGERFISRLGNTFNAPEWFKKAMPPMVLDGELWAGRGKFRQVVGAVKKQVPIDYEWDQVAYLPFDLPTLAKPWEARLEILAEQLAPNYDRLIPLPHERCENLEWLAARMDFVIGLGGEGLMARAPRSLYVGKRSSTLLKIKRFLDAEATVTGYQAGKGKHEGSMGALEMLGDDGAKFKIGTGFSDSERDNPPPIGSRVTFRFQEKSDEGVPRFPSYVGWRNYE